MGKEFPKELMPHHAVAADKQDFPDPIRAGISLKYLTGKKEKGKIQLATK